jgi:uncharacterized protein (TIGR00661 family)
MASMVRVVVIWVSLVQLLKHYNKAGHQVDTLISGAKYDTHLPLTPTYQFKGVSFVFTDGKVDYFKTLRSNSIKQLIHDIKQFDPRTYDLIISDFEPISAWSANMRKVPSIALSHQAAFLSAKTPRPPIKHHIAELILRYFAPCDAHLGMHFMPYDTDIVAPLIKPTILDAKASVCDHGHILIYLWHLTIDEIQDICTPFPEQAFHVFSPRVDSSITTGNITIYPTDEAQFHRSLLSCKGVITAWWFELPAECMYLEKPLLMIPQQWQYEQQCNAAAYAAMGWIVSGKLTTETLQHRFAHSTSQPHITIDHTHPHEIVGMIEGIVANVTLNYSSRHR